MESEKDKKNQKNTDTLTDLQQKKNEETDARSNAQSTEENIVSDEHDKSEVDEESKKTTKQDKPKKGTTTATLSLTSFIAMRWEPTILIFLLLDALNIGNSSWFYLTKALTQQFVEREFETLNGVNINYNSIRTAADFWFYVENHLIGSFFWESVYGYDENDSDAKIDEDAMNILYENQVLGVPRIRQVKVKNDSCVVHDYFRRLFVNCYDQYSSDKEDTNTFGPGDSTAWIHSDESATKQLSYHGKITTYGGGGFYADLLKSKNETKTMFQDLKENLWITRGTRAVFVDFTTFNPNINIFGICKLVLEFPSSGGVLPSVEFRSVYLKQLGTAQDWFLMICENSIYVFATIFLMRSLREIVYFKLKYFKLFWSYINLVIIGCCVTNGVFTILNISNDPATIDAYKKNPDKYGNFEYFGYLHILQNDIFAVNLFFTYIKIFEYLNFNRTMGQLNNTLKKKLPHFFSAFLTLWDFRLCFFIIFFAFAELGYLIFGSQVESFSSFAVAMFTLLRTILGDFDYPEIERANRILAPTFFLSYIFLVFFVLLNMFLAIINDTYADVKTEIAIAPDEMQMTEYLQRGFFNTLRKLGCTRVEKSELKREVNVTIRHIREALKKYGKYNIDPIAEVDHDDMEKLLAELEAILSDVARKEGGLDDYVHVNDFVSQQNRLEQIDKTISMLVTQVKTLLLKLEKMESVKKVKN
ncbi:hypothetical protein NQ315_000581 [Exocentrus adspersus]|uniref:Polycystic kidney disease 2-like 1 protein n=1 Tax=Exocentrus adspersus TaxID=1586481 RepID=A0AAV8VD34_9CUCU|nr:hypothetical protein NQ315_000581 [Exocentrus adspersus]